MGAKKTAGGARGKSPAPPEREEEDPTQRALRLKEAADVRDAMREQIRRDREQKRAALRKARDAVLLPCRHL